ncbi:MAG: 50S ribosomal protein L35 [Nitrospiria bacterium]
MKLKMKTHRGAAKRFKKTGSGKFRRNKAGKRHLLNHKSSKRKRKMSGSVLVFKGETKALQRALPYSP